MRRNRQVVPAQETVGEVGLKFETLAEQGGSARLPDKSRGKRQAGLTGAYDTERKTRMAGAGDAAGVHPGVGGVSERDHGEAHRDSRTGSNHAESRGQKCFRGEPDAAIARTGVARGGPNLQRPAHQRGGAANTDVGPADESVATGACGAEPGSAAIANSAAGRQFAARFTNRTTADGIASGRSFRIDDGGAAGGYGGDSESQARRGSGDAASGRAGFARST